MGDMLKLAVAPAKAGIESNAGWCIRYFGPLDAKNAERPANSRIGGGNDGTTQ